MVLRCERGETLHNLMLKSQCFCEPISLGCDLHKCFMAPHSLGETGRLEGNEWLHALPFRWDEVLVKSFSLESRPLCGESSSLVFLTGYLFPASAKSLSRYFLALNSDSKVGFLVVKPMKVSDCGPQKSLIFKLMHTQTPVIH